MIVFDCTNEETFRNIPNWIEEIKKNSSPNVRLVLVGNKSDLKDKRVISQQQAEGFAKEHNIPYIESSAKQSINVDEAFQKIVTGVIESKNYLENTLKESNIKDLQKPNQESSCVC